MFSLLHRDLQSASLDFLPRSTTKFRNTLLIFPLLNLTSFSRKCLSLTNISNMLFHRFSLLTPGRSGVNHRSLANTKRVHSFVNGWEACSTAASSVIIIHLTASWKRWLKQSNSDNRTSCSCSDWRYSCHPQAQKHLITTIRILRAWIPENECACLISVSFHPPAVREPCMPFLSQHTFSRIGCKHFYVVGLWGSLPVNHKRNFLPRCVKNV